jgi:hypothetical protein
MDKDQTLTATFGPPKGTKLKFKQKRKSAAFSFEAPARSPALNVS